MAQSEEQPTGRRDAFVLVAVVVVAVALSLVVVVVTIYTDRTAEDEIAALGEQDLLRVEDMSRLPATFTPAPDVSDVLPIEAEVYVPVYSSIYAGKGALRSDLAATLSIRNTSLSNAIVIRAVRYFDTDGNELSRFVDGPHRLGPMATADFFIDATDIRGGTGANFIVNWASETAVSEPLIEAIMIGSIGARGISLISRGSRADTVSIPVPSEE